MVYKILVASYTSEIVTLVFDPADPISGNASLKKIASLEVGEHPSWITRDVKDSSIFFTGLEQSTGYLLTLKYDLESGTGSVISKVESGGAAPCTILSLKDDVLVGNYSSGTVGFFTSPPNVKETQAPMQFTGSGPNESRQEQSHAHQVYLSGDEVLVPDLGADKVRRLAKNTDGLWEEKDVVVYDKFPGGGPRHVEVYDGILYTLLELTSELTAHSFPPLSENSKPTLLASASTLPENTTASPSGPPLLAAEILIPPPNKTFPTALIYISNRNDPHPEGDSIAIFSTYKDGKLEKIKSIRTGLHHVRGMIFFGPDDRYLIAGGASGGGIKVYERTEGGASLKEIVHLPVGESEAKEGLAPTGFATL